MRILVIQNERNTTISLAGECLERAGAKLEVVQPHSGDGLPRNSNRFDGAVILGGPQHGGDDENFPAFPAILDLIQDFHANTKPLLGLCLGSQLIARAFGKPIRRHHTFEWGFSPIEITEEGRQDALLSGLAPQQRIMQWHEDTFDLPENAVHLMTGDITRVQAFRLGSSTYGFQCHFELSRELAEHWLEMWGEATAKRRYSSIDAPRQLARVKAELPAHIEGAAAFCRNVAQRWAQLVERRKSELAA